jgi:hypothetical protein
MFTIQQAARTTSTPYVQNAFQKVKTLVAVYGAFSATVLITVVILAITGQQVNSFMWGRAAGMFASAIVTYWLTTQAAQGKRWAHIRVRLISVIVPIAVIALDSIPGALPLWFIVLQVAGALAFLPAAFIMNRPSMRAAAPKTR